MDWKVQVTLRVGSMQIPSGSQVRTLSPVLSTPSCPPRPVSRWGYHGLDLTVASVAPEFVICLSHYKDRSTGQGLCFAHCHVSATTTVPGPEQVPHDHLLSESVKRMKAFPSEEPKKVAWGSWR